MKAETCDLSGIIVFTPRRFLDDRGFLCETWNRERMADIGIGVEFVQENQSYSAARSTFRGFHFQRPPCAQVKLVRVSRGAALDIVIDIRRGSPTFGRHFGVELSAENGRQIYVPVGFAHSFLTLQPDTEVLYKASEFYAPDAEGGLRYDDPAFNIDWPVALDDFMVNDRDKSWPDLGSLECVF
jgi:dTDP-4-dehydrorhamnose 3,5-epimerase